MTNKNPVTRIVNYPARFKPLLDRELEEKGIFSYSELMGRILAEHFGINPKNTNIEDNSRIIEGEKING